MVSIRIDCFARARHSGSKVNATTISNEPVGSLQYSPSLPANMHSKAAVKDVTRPTMVTQIFALG